MANSETNSASIVSCLEELENVTISREQVKIVGKAVEKDTRSTTNPLVAELGGILTYQWGFHTNIEEEDYNEKANIVEDYEEEEMIEEVLSYVDEVFEPSDNLLATPAKDNTEESVQLTPPSSNYDSSPDRNSIMVGSRMDSTRLHYVTITTPTEAATFSDLNISSFPSQIPAQLPLRKASRKRTMSEEDDSTFMTGKSRKKHRWSCHLCGEGGTDKRAKCI